MLRTSYSELTAHRICPEAWNYGYHRRLEKDDPADTAIGREFGSWWHLLAAADALERGRALGSLRAVPGKLRAVDDGPVLAGDTITREEVLEHAEHWWNTRTPETRELWVDHLGESLPDRLRHLFARWMVRWGEDIALELPLAVELRWTRALPVVNRPEGALDPQTEITGAIDEVYLDRKRGLVVVRDRKATKDLPMSAELDMMDSQLQLYAWGVAPIVKSWGVGRVGAVGYDRVRAVAPQPPRLTQSGRLAVYQGQPSVSNCDLHTYLEWARGEDGQGVPYSGRKKDGSDGGRYTVEQSVVEKLSTPAARSIWLQRTLTPLNVNLVKTHLRSAVDSAVDLVASRARVQRTNEAARNLTARCKWCDFHRLCRAEMIGGPESAENTYDLNDFRLRPRNGRARG